MLERLFRRGLDIGDGDGVRIFIVGIRLRFGSGRIRALQRLHEIRFGVDLKDSGRSLLAPFQRECGTRRFVCRLFLFCLTIVGKKGVAAEKQFILGLRGAGRCLGFQRDQSSRDGRHQLGVAISSFQGALPAPFVQAGEVFVVFKEAGSTFDDALQHLGKVLDLLFHGIESRGHRQLFQLGGVVPASGVVVGVGARHQTHPAGVRVGEASLAVEVEAAEQIDHPRFAGVHFQTVQAETQQPSQALAVNGVVS